jgi:hypothetical protein
MSGRQVGGLLLTLLVPAVAAAQPAATRGRPVPLSAAPSGNDSPSLSVRQASYEPDPPPSSRERLTGATLRAPSYITPVDDGSVPPARPAPESGSPAEDILSGRRTSRSGNDEHTANFGERIKEWLEPGHQRDCDYRRWFESDHHFDYFASPITNPFLFEDPRSLTEVRPIFMFQTIPDADPNFRGGNIEFYGVQARVAFNDQFSFVIHKLGWISINPGSGSNQPGGTGFAEVWLGPKFTFLRDDQNCLLGAGGLIFQIPSGPPRVYQDTGSLSLTPYVSFAKNFLNTRFGSFNVMDTFGYSFATDKFRSDYLFNSLHLDFDIANNDRIYPMLEFHYFQYTISGGARNLGVEGRDLANLGDVNSGGNANFNIAAGVRFKINEGTQAGIAVEFPLNNRKDLNAFRLTVDFIWRY